jgi:hypothetical protein
LTFSGVQSVISQKTVSFIFSYSIDLYRLLSCPEVCIRAPEPARLSATAAQVRAQVKSSGICDGQSGTGAGFLSNTSVSSAHFHSTYCSTLIYDRVGTICQTVIDVPSGLSRTPPKETKELVGRCAVSVANRSFSAHAQSCMCGVGCESVIQRACAVLYVRCRLRIGHSARMRSLVRYRMACL